MQPGGQIRPHRPVADLNNTTINERTRGRGLERPGDGVIWSAESLRNTKNTSLK
jgi:hypothetical protein